MTEAELRAVWLACGDDDYGRIVRLLILTAQRRDEIGGMRWSELSASVDPATLLPMPALTLPPARTKNHREHSLPLSRAAIALLPPRRNDRDFVFGDGPRKSGDKQRGFSGWSKSKAALDARILEHTRMKAAIACLPFEVPKLSVTVNHRGMGDMLDRVHRERTGEGTPLERAWARSHAPQTAVVLTAERERER